MDSLHLFTIPKWLPNTLLPEIWAMIFRWKWRLEMREICNTKTLYKIAFYASSYLPGLQFCPYTKMTHYSGNKWYVRTCNIYDSYEPIRYVRPRCGIELIYEWFHSWPIGLAPLGLSHFNNTKTLHKHMSENLNIECSENLKLKEMMKLLRTV